MANFYDTDPLVSGSESNGIEPPEEQQFGGGMRERLQAAFVQSNFKSHSELARHTGVSISYLSRLFSETAFNPSLKTASLLASALGVSIDYLAGHQEEMARSEQSQLDDKLTYLRDFTNEKLEETLSRDWDNPRRAAFEDALAITAIRIEIESMITK